MSRTPGAFRRACRIPPRGRMHIPDQLRGADEEEERGGVAESHGVDPGACRADSSGVWVSLSSWKEGEDSGDEQVACCDKDGPITSLSCEEAGTVLHTCETLRKVGGGGQVGICECDRAYSTSNRWAGRVVSIQRAKVSRAVTAEM